MVSRRKHARKYIHQLQIQPRAEAKAGAQARSIETPGFEREISWPPPCTLLFDRRKNYRCCYRFQMCLLPTELSLRVSARRICASRRRNEPSTHKSLFVIAHVMHVRMPMFALGLVCACRRMDGRMYFGDGINVHTFTAASMTGYCGLSGR